MQTYRIADTVSTRVTDYIEPGFTCFRIMVPVPGTLSWTPLEPSKKELNKQEWFTSFKYMDPNEINKKMGMPPNYVILKRDEDSLKDWADKNFNIKEYTKISETDIIFEGEYKCSK